MSQTSIQLLLLAGAFRLAGTPLLGLVRDTR
jgi:hypothetical protein